MKSLAIALSLSCTLLVSRPGVGSEIALPAGTAVSVKLTDTIDSDRDPFGKQYAASVAEPVDIAGGHTIQAGSRATVVLVHNNSGWMTQLKAVIVNGRKLEVASSAGILAGKPSPAGGILRQIGIGSASAAGSNQRLLLPPATELRFSLTGSATPARVIAATPRSRPPARSRLSLGVSPAVSQQESGIAYLCSARDRSNPVLPFSYYIADAFETSDDPASVEKRWYQYLVATYPYRFANNHHAIIQCTRLPDLAGERDVRKKLEGESKSENGQIVQTRWRYTLGPTPVPATSPSSRATAP
jgi:hypothetical protein